MKISNTANSGFSYTLPDGEKILSGAVSNAAPAEILSDEILKIKSGKKTYIEAGKTAEQIIELTNNSSTTLLSPVLYDKLSDNGSFKPETIHIDGVVYPELNFMDGVPLSDIPPQSSVTVQYEVVAAEELTEAYITNTASVAFNVDDPIAGLRSFTENTNTVSFEVVKSKVTVTKSADVYFAVAGDILTYTASVANEGNIMASDLEFTDVLPRGTSFENNSVQINGINYPAYNPENGFPLPNIKPGDKVVVTFKVKVLSGK